jgi:hypothetical protein
VHSEFFMAFTFGRQILKFNPTQTNHKGYA